MGMSAGIWKIFLKSKEQKDSIFKRDLLSLGKRESGRLLKLHSQSRERIQNRVSGNVIVFQEVILVRNRSSERIGLTLCYGNGENEETDIFVSEVSDPGKLTVLHRELKCVMEIDVMEVMKCMTKSSHRFGLLLRRQICLNPVWIGGLRSPDSLALSRQPPGLATHTKCDGDHYHHSSLWYFCQEYDLLNEHRETSRLHMEWPNSEKLAQSIADVAIPKAKIDFSNKYGFLFSISMRLQYQIVAQMTQGASKVFIPSHTWVKPPFWWISWNTIHQNYVLWTTQ